MKISIKKIKADKIVFWGFLVSFFLVFINTSYVIFSFSHLPPFIPLFNQMPWGEARLGQRWEIFSPLSIAFTILIGNFILSSIIYTKMPLVSRIISITSLLICFFALLFSIRTILLII
ncbi:MAG: hypothetical protein Q8P80_03660 [Candidatus Levybacteria bacterium]|nr:hypothetical protein [Candidatus Levybacteria bacterium]